MMVVYILIILGEDMEFHPFLLAWKLVWPTCCLLIIHRHGYILFEITGVPLPPLLFLLWALFYRFGELMGGDRYFVVGTFEQFYMYSLLCLLRCCCDNSCLLFWHCPTTFVNFCVDILIFFWWALLPLPTVVMPVQWTFLGHYPGVLNWPIPSLFRTLFSLFWLDFETTTEFIDLDYSGPRTQWFVGGVDHILAPDIPTNPAFITTRWTWQIRTEPPLYSGSLSLSLSHSRIGRKVEFEFFRVGTGNVKIGNSAGVALAWECSWHQCLSHSVSPLFSFSLSHLSSHSSISSLLMILLMTLLTGWPVHLPLAFTSPSIHCPYFVFVLI